MSFSRLVHALTLAPVLLCSLSDASPARAGIEVQSFFAQKYQGSTFRFVYDTDFPGPSLNEPGAQYLFETRAGTWGPSDISNGLYFDPDLRGTPFSLGGHTARTQAIELLLDTSGPNAFNDEPGTRFDIGATYQIKPYGRIIAGIALTNLFHQPTSPDKRAFGVVAWQDPLGQTYVTSKNFLSGEIIAQEWVDPKYVELDLFMSRVDPTSSSVRMGARARDDAGAFETFELRAQIAFSDVVLRPAIFAAAPIPEPKAWAMLLASLIVIAAKLGRERARRVVRNNSFRAIDLPTRPHG